MTSRLRPVQLASIAAPVLALMLVLSAVMLPALAPWVMGAGRVLLVVGVLFAAAAAAGTLVRRPWTWFAVSVVASGLMLDPLVAMLTRPLSSGPSAPLAAVVFVVAAGAAAVPSVLTRARAVLAAVLLAFAASTVAVSSLGVGVAPAAVLMWAVGASAPALLLTPVLLRVLRGDWPSRTPLVVLVGVAACAPVVYLQQAMMLQAADLVSAERTLALQTYVAAFVLAAVTLAVTAMLPRAVAVRAVVRVGLLVPVLLVGVVVVPAALPPLSEPVDKGLARVESARAADLAIVAGMTGEEGAGPRDEFRGLSFYDCDAINSRDCFITVYDDMALKHGVKAAVDDVLMRVRENKGVTFPAHCHQVVHNLGQLAFTLAPKFADAARIDPQVCGTGYTHGLWEQQFNRLGDKAIFTRTGTLCTELNMVTPWYRWTCSHILGHMMNTKMMDNPARSLEYCLDIKESQGFTDCLAGGWMNFFQDDVVISKMRTDDDLKRLFSVCYGASTETKFLCYQELFPVIYAMVDGSDYLAAQACLQHAEPGRDPNGDRWGWDVSYADRCVQGLARGVSVSSFQDYRLITPRCLSMPLDAQDPCLTAAAASVVLNTGSTKAAFAVCRSVGDEDYRNYCYFWAKNARNLLANGPNSEHLPTPDEVRLPEAPFDQSGQRNPVPAPQQPSRDGTAGGESAVDPGRS